MTKKYVLIIEIVQGIIRKMDQQNCFSPKSSPRRIQDSSTGTLKTKISLGQKYPQIINSGPFYLVKEPPEKNKLTASTNM